LPKFLIIRFSSIGDIVLTTPVVRCLKQQFPGAEVHYLTKPGYRNLLEHNPYISHVHVLDKPLLQKALELKSFGFDYVIDLHNNLRTRIIKSVIDVPAFSFDKLNTEKAQLVRFKQNILPAVHIVDRYLQTLAPFEVTNDGQGIDYFLPPDLEQHFSISQLIPSGTFVAFAIGAQHATKRLPAEKIAEICTGLNTTVVLLGGKEDEAAGNDIAQRSGQHVISLCGLLTLHQSAFVVSKAKKVITHDTGLMHIAAAFKKEIISVWGNTVPEFGMTPYYGKSEVQHSKFEVRNLDCRPCSKIGYKECPLKHFNCMNLQDTQAIFSAANQ
jgi:ADP-heptose:LPS heptosyltransferase